jgi:methylenetetrahydrofolate dehydrogenase (NADP+)/methenyltetrahydrofolate cyclohydrolase
MDAGKKGTIIDGREVAAALRAELKGEVAALRSRTGSAPGLAVVLAGDNPASKVYVRNKTRACEEVGIRSFQHTLPEGTATAEIARLIGDLNSSPDVHGILVQLPLPAHVDASAVIEAISPAKDVDGFHPCNLGRLLIGSPAFQPCTPAGVMRLLDHYGVEVSGAHAVVVGRSNIVGKPMALMLLKRNATVTICHSRTPDLPARIKEADILVAAIGKDRFIKGGWVKEGAVVIDVGMNRSADGRLTGDVDYESASSRASLITPVPGGVGPMTVAMLLKNTVDAFKAVSSAGAVP